MCNLWFLKMGKIKSSVLGEITGKVGPFVFQRHKGKRIIKIYSKPQKPPTLRQKNVKLAFGFVSHLSNVLQKSVISPIWEPLAKRKRLTGAVYFCKENVGILYDSMPQPDKLYHKNNLPDISRLFLSLGVADPVQRIERLEYDRQTGEVKVFWDGRHFSTGRADDKVYLVVIHWEISYQGLKYYGKKCKNGTGKFPAPKPWSKLKVWGDALNPIAIRSDGAASLEIDKGIKKGQLVAWLFFSQYEVLKSKQGVVFSESRSRSILV